MSAADQISEEELEQIYVEQAADLVELARESDDPKAWLAGPEAYVLRHRPRVRELVCQALDIAPGETITGASVERSESRDSDSITALYALQGAPRKSFTAIEGGWHPCSYSSGYIWRIFEAEVNDFASLHAALRTITGNTQLCVVRGDPAPGVSRTRCKRNKANLLAADRHWLPLDIDKLALPDCVDPCNGEAVARYAIEHLPDCFRDVSAVWQSTSSAGLFDRQARCRLWFWLDRKVSEDELKIWLAAEIKTGVVDPSCWRQAQPIYTAPPMFDPPEADPIQTRLGVIEGVGDTAAVPEIVMPEPEAVAAPSSGPKPKSLPERWRSIGGRRVDGIVRGIVATCPVCGVVDAIAWVDGGKPSCESCPDQAVHRRLADMGLWVHHAGEFVDFEKIRELARLRAREIVERWFPGGVYAGQEYVTLNRKRGDRTLGSFLINTDTGKWADFALDDASGFDLIDLTAYRHDVDRIAAARMLAHMLGV